MKLSKITKAVVAEAPAKKETVVANAPVSKKASTTAKVDPAIEGVINLQSRIGTAKILHLVADAVANGSKIVIDGKEFSLAYGEIENTVKTIADTEEAPRKKAVVATAAKKELTSAELTQQLVDDVKQLAGAKITAATRKALIERAEAIAEPLDEVSDKALVAKLEKCLDFLDEKVGVATEKAAAKITAAPAKKAAKVEEEVADEDSFTFDLEVFGESDELEEVIRVTLPTQWSIVLEACGDEDIAKLFVCLLVKEAAYGSYGDNLAYLYCGDKVRNFRAKYDALYEAIGTTVGLVEAAPAKAEAFNFKALQNAKGRYVYPVVEVINVDELPF
jgi:hypothetical protein